MGEIVKATRNHQVTVPTTIRAKAGINVGDIVRVTYDERDGVIKIIPPRRKRTTIRIGRKITIKRIEEAIEKIMDEVEI